MRKKSIAARVSSSSGMKSVNLPFFTSSEILCNEESQDNSIYYPNTKVNL